MGAEVKVDGIWLRSLGHVTPPKWSTRWGTGPCGADLASCAVAVSPSADSPLLRIGRRFEVWEGGVLRFGGETSQPGRGFPWVLNARGYARRAGDFDAVDSSGEPTTNPRTGAAEAILDGLPWTTAAVFDNTSLGTDGTPSVTRLDTVLDNYHVTAGKRWGTDDYGVPFVATDPDEPSWWLDASDLEIGTADDALYTRVRARYVSSVDGGEPDGWASVEFPPEPIDLDDYPAIGLYGSIWWPMDLTPLGLISGGTAAAHAQAQLALLTIPQWLNRITTNSGRLKTAGGLPAHLPSVRAGQVVRLYKVPNTLGGVRNRLALDIVLGEVEYDAGNASEITLAPVGLAVRNLADAFAQAAEAARRAAEASKPRVVK